MAQDSSNLPQGVGNIPGLRSLPQGAGSITLRQRICGVLCCVLLEARHPAAASRWCIPAASRHCQKGRYLMPDSPRPHPALPAVPHLWQRPREVHGGEARGVGQEPGAAGQDGEGGVCKERVCVHMCVGRWNLGQLVTRVRAGGASSCTCVWRWRVGGWVGGEPGRGSRWYRG